MGMKEREGPGRKASGSQRQCAARISLGRHPAEERASNGQCKIKQWYGELVNTEDPREVSGYMQREN